MKPSKTEMVINVIIDCDISFWNALKLRLAGKNFKIIADGVLNEILERYKRNDKCQKSS
jgi:hypothetical protein